MDRLPRTAQHILLKAFVLGAAALGLGVLTPSPARGITVLIIAQGSCDDLLNARLPEDMLMLQDFDRNSCDWVTPCTDPGALAWLAGAMGTPIDPGSAVQPIRDSDLISAFYAALAGMPNAIFPNADFNHDGSPGTDADIQAFWNALDGNGTMPLESVPLSPAAALSIPGLLALGLRRRR
jgi:hypothetical protein